MSAIAPKAQQTTLVFEHIQGFCQTINQMGWDVDFSPLSNGEASTATVFASEHSTVIQGRFGNALVQRGCTPNNSINFGITPGLLDPIPWNNYSVDHKQLLPFGQGDEFESISQQDFQCIVLSFDAIYFQTLADKLGIHSLQSHTNNGAPLTLKDTSHRELLGIVDKIQSQGPASLLDEDLATTLLSGLDNSKQNHRRNSIPSRDKLRKTAVDYIQQNIEEPIAIKQLSELCGCSWKTLERVFKEYYQLNPKQFISSLRLEAVYKALLSAEPSARVNEIAGHWGYWHMGDFSRDFRRQYGCLPSDVLHKR